MDGQWSGFEGNLLETTARINLETLYLELKIAIVITERRLKSYESGTGVSSVT